MFCWGSTVNGELGFGGIEEEHIFLPRRLDKPWARDVVQISSGNHHTVFVTRSGRIYSCGSDDSGQLGHTKETKKKPEKIDTLEDHHIVSAACGGNHTLALNSNGQVFVWGANHFGQLGLGKKSDSILVPKPTFMHKFADKKVLQVAAGEKHSLALLENGDLYAWGSNSHGQLGIGKKGGSESVPTLISSLTGVPIKQISCGSSHSIVLTKSGGVFAFGRNQFGQLGMNDEADRHYPSLMRTIRSQRICFMVAGGDHTVGLTLEGGVFTFGAGMYGQLGHGSASNEFLPRRVLELMGNEVTQIACGRKHTLAFIESRGKLYAFGLGGSGQLGLKSGRNSLVPVVVPGPWRTPHDKGKEKEDGESSGFFRAVYAGSDQSFVSITSQEEGYRPADYRKLPKKNQILVFSIEAMNRLLQLGPKDPVSPEDTKYVDHVTRSTACVNGSFLVGDKKHYGCGSKNVGVDLKEVQEFWQKVAEIKNEVLKQSIHKGISGMVKTLAKSPPDVEALRLYVILPFYHEFDDPNNRVVFQVPFAQAVLALPEPALRVVGIWWATVSPDLFSRLVFVYKSVVKFILKNSNSAKEGPRTQTQVKNMKASLEILKLLSALVKDHTMKARLQDFYIPELVEYEDIARDYIRFRYNKHDDADSLYFCNYPFIFDASAKTVLLQTDAALQMHSAMNENQVLQLFPFPHLQVQNQFLVFIVSRDNIVQDTLRTLLKAPASDLKKPLRVVFAGEEAIDAGGVRKEFFILLMRELLNPKYGMFYSYPETNVVWFSEASFEDNSMYFLVGVICGLAIYNFTIIDLPFPLAMYKKLLKEEVGLGDLADLSPTLVKTLQDLLNYDENDEEDKFSLAFEITREVYGDVRTVELKPNGSTIPVTSHNKKEYVDLYVKYILETSIETSFSAFSQGFHYVCGSYILSLFRAEELMALVVGNEDYDWDQFEKNAEYKNGYTKDDPSVRLFWKVFHGLAPEDKKKFLKFLTGTDRIPILGMKAVKIFIQPTGGGERYFPVAHTCFNLLDLPRYKSAEVLKEKLLWSIQQTEGFTLV